MPRGQSSSPSKIAGLGDSHSGSFAVLIKLKPIYAKIRRLRPEALGIAMGARVGKSHVIENDRL
jgi:hypothetical protein